MITLSVSADDVYESENIELTRWLYYMVVYYLLQWTCILTVRMHFERVNRSDVDPRCEHVRCGDATLSPVVERDVFVSNISLAPLSLDRDVRTNANRLNVDCLGRCRCRRYRHVVIVEGENTHENPSTSRRHTHTHARARVE